MATDDVAYLRTIAGKPRRKPKHVGVYSRHINLGGIDGRLREGKVIKEITTELTAHCGGRPSAVQRRLIQRAAMLHLRLVLLDEKTEPDGSLSERTAREYLAWNNSYCRTLRLLGLKGAPDRQPSLADILAAAPASSSQKPPATPPRIPAPAESGALYDPPGTSGAGTTDVATDAAGAIGGQVNGPSQWRQ